ncbi:MAG: hypothetical protein SEPTF4163_002778 [Sporothrix epigloea]
MSSDGSPDATKVKAESMTEDDKAEIFDSVVAMIEKDHFFCDGVLHGLIDEYLGDWTISDLSSMGGVRLLKLTNLLRQRGVYVSNHRVAGGSRAKSIHDTVNSGEPPEWPEGTLEKFSNGTNMMTRHIDLVTRIPFASIHPDFQALARARL